MTEIGIGIIGGGYMGKAHAVAMTAVGPVFNTELRPRLEMVAATSDATAERYRAAFGFARGTADWMTLVQDPKVDAVVIASPQTTHLEIVRAAVAADKHILCEKPLGEDLTAAREIEALAIKAGIIHMTGFNYIRTPASQFARHLLADGEIGTPTFFRIEHTEDFLADPKAPANWRTEGRATGTMGDLAPHPINAALALGGPIQAVMADITTAFPTRPGPNGPVPVKNDDTAQIMCRFESGATGHIFSSRVATGRKMGYAYDIYGSAGAIRFDGEDQNALWLYRMDAPHDGFQKILIGPQHPDYLPFCQGPGHGTGYQDQITIEAKDFLEAIAAKTPRFPTFSDGRAVAEVVEAAHLSFENGRWTALSDLP